ncbi:hypothetical protein FACS1894124_2200 [Spirochaetia bacterium]|nr:hypothetical protein FACS1894124_2200 [Spirochaetia bacterium]
MMNKQVNKTIKLVCVLTALAAMVIAAGCNNLLGPAKSGAKPGDGKGLVTISLGDLTGRTLLPTPTDLRLHIDTWELTFTEVSSEAIVTIPDWDGDGTSPLELAEGTWSLALVAKKGGDTVASGASTANFTVAAAAPVTVAVNLVFAAPDPSHTGSLEYTITESTSAITLDASPIAVVLRPLSGGPDVSVGTTISGSKNDVPAGYYLVIATLTAGTDEAVKSDVAHIYKDQVTKAAWTFDDTDFHAAEVYIKGTLSGGVHSGIVTLYEDNGKVTTLGSVTLSKSETWRLGIPKSYTGQVYAQIAYQGQESALVEWTGSDIDLSLTPVVPQGVNAAPWYKTVSADIADGSAGRAADGNITTNWAVGTSVTSATLTLEFGFDITVNAIVLRSARDDNVSRFKVEYSADGETWTEAYEYYNGGAGLPGSANTSSGDVPFPVFLVTPFTAGYVRLSLSALAANPARPVAIWEFELYDAFDRSALNGDIAAATSLLDATKTRLPAENAANLYNGYYWATAAEKTAYQTAITAAKAIAQDPSKTVAEIAAAVGTLAGATSTFNGERVQGQAASSNLNLLAAIAKATALKAYYKDAENGGALYENLLYASAAVKSAYQTAINTATTASTSGATQDDFDDAETDLDTATATFKANAGHGDLPNATGTNIAPRYMTVWTNSVYGQTGESFYGPSAGRGPQLAVDGGDGKANSNDSRWATKSLTTDIYLEVDFGLPVTIDNSVIKVWGNGTSVAGKITGFKIEYWVEGSGAGSGWQTAYDYPNGSTELRGNNNGNPVACAFASPLTSSKFRLALTEKTDPSIAEWELYVAAPPSP